MDIALSLRIREKQLCPSWLPLKPHPIKLLPVRVGTRQTFKCLASSWFCYSSAVCICLLHRLREQGAVLLISDLPIWFLSPRRNRDRGFKPFSTEVGTPHSALKPLHPRKCSKRIGLLMVWVLLVVVVVVA